MADVLLVTCSAHPQGDEDAAALIAALRAVGLSASWSEWDDPDVDWSTELVVLRSTWDYTLRRQQFLAWAATVAQLLNPVDVVRWNSDKSYLLDLAEAGVGIVPTRSTVFDEQLELPTAGDFVVKPSVGAGSRGAGRFGPDDHAAARRHAQHLHEEGRTVLVQPYLEAVDTAGETALIYLSGSYSHAIRKAALLPQGTRHDVRSKTLYVEESICAREPSPAELAVGEQTMAALRQRFGPDLLYARVDLLPGPDGPLVIEVELIEPSLFLGYSLGAADRFAAAIRRRASNHRAVGAPA